MRTKAPLILSLTVLMLAACGEETRNGDLTLTGSAPVRIVDEGGKTVEFGAGPTQVTFSAGSSRKFTVTVSQGKDKTAKFTGKAPSSDETWNFTLRGRDIGQPVDMASTRDLELYGPVWRRTGDGGTCGFNGRWVTEEEYQDCNEDWKVAFNDAATSASVGSFHARREKLSCFLGSRNIYCREEPRPVPMPRRPLVKMDGEIKRLNELTETGVHFD